MVSPVTWKVHESTGGIESAQLFLQHTATLRTIFVRVRSYAQARWYYISITDPVSSTCSLSYVTPPGNFPLLRWSRISRYLTFKANTGLKKLHLLKQRFKCSPHPDSSVVCPKLQLFVGGGIVLWHKNYCNLVEESFDCSAVVLKICWL